MKLVKGTLTSCVMVFFVMLLTIGVSSAGFDWGSGDGDCSGSGSFQQQINHDDIVEVGEIPAGKEGVYIQLTSDEDVDVQLYDVYSGEKIVHWPSGILSGCCEQTTAYHGVTVEWSGYNGDGAGLGHEYIKIGGMTNRPFMMKAFGYRSGYATVDYSWTGTEGCSSGGPAESGSGTFQQQIAHDDIVEVGELIEGLNNVHIELICDEDVDIQLYDKDTGERIVHWPSGILSGCCEQTTAYHGVTVEWSGYNGDGTGLGHEYVRITGTTNRPFIMKAFGYQSGYATVNYTWGNNDEAGDLDPNDYNPGDDSALCGGSVCSCTFPDVDQNKWYAKYVNGLCSAGVLIGYQAGPDKGYYKPAEDANLAETLNVLLTSNDYENVKKQCSDSDPWYECYFGIAQAKGLSVYASDAADPVYRYDVIRYTAKIFFNYTGQDPVAFLKNRGVTNGERLWDYANRAELAVFASLAANEAGKPIPYGLYAAPPSADPDLPDPVIDTNDSVVNRARAQLGKKGHPWTDSQYTYCARFVRMMHEKPAKWGTAYDMTKHFKDKGKLRTTGNPMAGAAVCYEKSAGNGYAGHISIATGDGTEIGVTSLVHGVTEKSVKTVGNFWGWISPSDFVNFY